MAANREVRAAVESSRAVARRGRYSERVWADVRIAARIAREEGVSLTVHGINILVQLKQLKKMNTRTAHKVQKQPTEAVAPQKRQAVSDEASPRLPSKRHQRSAQRPLDYQEKKRAELTAAEMAATGQTYAAARLSVRQAEGARLEVIAQKRAQRANSECASSTRCADSDVGGATAMEEDACSAAKEPPRAQLDPG